MTALDQDRRLLNSFLRELVKVVPPIAATKLRMLEQQYPWSQDLPEDELERRGIPDGWIYDSDEEWCVFVESKVLTHLHAGQIERHRRTAYQRGFRRVVAVAIVPQLDVRVPEDTTLLEWRTVYDWLSRHRARSTWAARASNKDKHVEPHTIFNVLRGPTVSEIRVSEVSTCQNEVRPFQIEEVIR
jgi:hypothetical protein